MLTVSIAVNDKVIYARTAVNRIEEKGCYVSDDGRLIKHNPEDGAVELAIKLLKTIKEVK